MAIIKKKQLKSMPPAELKAKLVEVTAELSRERSSAQKPKNSAKAKELKKLLSRIQNYLSLKSKATSSISP